MKNWFFFLNLIFQSFYSFSNKEVKKEDSLRQDYAVRSISRDPSVPMNEEHYDFLFHYQTMLYGQTTLDYSVNNEVYSTAIDSNFSLQLSRGNSENTFQFFIPGYVEITVPPLKAQHGSKVVIDLYFNHQEYNTIICDKPVIYLYPTEPTIVDVRVEPVGTFTFTYPFYNEGWKVTANPSGDLLVDNEHYNYLFWESSQQMNMEMVDLEKGSLVEGKNALTFLEDQLTAVGFNSKEKADFITFWGPQLKKNKLNYIHFVVNDDCDQFASLEISPKPDHQYRFYILTFPVESDNGFKLEKQQLPKMNREGFTVLEWGGSQIKTIHSPNIFN